MGSSEKIKQKYYALIPRSYSTKLELFLFSRCHLEGKIGEFTFQDFKYFEITEELVNEYLKALNLEDNDRLKETGLTMKEIDDKIESWHKDYDFFKYELLAQYKLNFITDFFPYSDFEEIYNADPAKRVCHYCHINDMELEILDLKGQIKTKRSRGFMMEVDRIKPNYEYSKDNAVLACYWCNNAKTDEFTSKEFSSHIGPGIGDVWEERISG